MPHKLFAVATSSERRMEIVPRKAATAAETLTM